MLDDVATDISTEPPTEDGDDILGECVLDDCVLPERVLEGCVLLGCEFDACMVGEDELRVRKLNGSTPRDDTLEPTVFDDFVGRETKFDDAVLGDGPVVTKVVGEASVIKDALDESTGSVDKLAESWRDEVSVDWENGALNAKDVVAMVTDVEEAVSDKGDLADEDDFIDKEDG